MPAAVEARRCLYLLGGRVPTGSFSELRRPMQFVRLVVLYASIEGDVKLGRYTNRLLVERADGNLPVLGGGWMVAQKMRWHAGGQL